jgi:hypothetical protein
VRWSVPAAEVVAPENASPVDDLVRLLDHLKIERACLACPMESGAFRAERKMVVLP